MSFRAFVILLLIGWGALAFGAPYPWAYIPLFLVAAAVGLSGLIARRRSGGIDRLTAIALVLVAFAIGLQLTPLPQSTITTLSPETDALLRRDAVGYGVSDRWHPLSIAPGSSTLALAAFASLSIFLLGSARSLTTDETRTIAGGVSAIGVVLAIAGFAQKALWNGKLYGFWVPEQLGSPFGPFDNHNHFAGWMLMAIPLTLGLLFERLARRKPLKPGWRNRLLWLSSPDANKTALLGFSILLMAIALVMTMSRSGILGLLLAVAVSGWLVARRPSSGSRRLVTGAYLALLVVVAGGWVGFDAVASRLSPASVSTMGGRWGVWKDGWDIARRFPLTGTGLNTYGAATPYYQTFQRHLHYSTAHNDYLQLLAEGGFLLCVPLAFAMLAGARAVRRRLRDEPGELHWIRIGAVTGILAIALQEIAEFSLQMPGNAIMFALLCAIALRTPEMSTRHAAGGHRGAAA